MKDEKSTTPLPARAASLLLALPAEIKIRIASFLPTRSAIDLACTCKSLIDIGESRSWRSLSVRAHAKHDSTVSECGAGCGYLPACITTIWTRFESRINARPSRRYHITYIDYEITSDAVPLAARLIPLFPNLREVKEREAGSTSRDYSRVGGQVGHTVARQSGCSALEVCGELCNVHHAHLGASNGTLCDLLCAIKSLPNVKSLYVQHGHTGTEERCPADLPQLTHLTELEVDNLDIVFPCDCSGPFDDDWRNDRGAGFKCEWPDVLAALLKKAPHLCYLTVQAGESNWCIYDLRILRRYTFESKSIRHLTLSLQLSGLPEWGGILEDWFPNLEVLVLTAQGNEDSVPEHSKLRLLGLSNWADISYPCCFGAAPTLGCTGSLYDWVPDSLDRAPALLYLDDRPADRRNPIDNARKSGLRFTTFTNGVDTLYHARKTLRFISLNAMDWYRPWVLQPSPVAWPDYLAWEYGIEDEGLRYAPDTSEKHLEEAQIVNRDESVDFSWYNRRELPCALLDYVYQRAEKDRHWVDGTRGEALPEDVWQLLRDWNAEITASEVAHSYGSGSEEA